MPHRRKPLPSGLSKSALEEYPDVCYEIAFRLLDDHDLASQVTDELLEDVRRAFASGEDRPSVEMWLSTEVIRRARLRRGAAGESSTRNPAPRRREIPCPALSAFARNRPLALLTGRLPDAEAYAVTRYYLRGATILQLHAETGTEPEVLQRRLSDAIARMCAMVQEGDPALTARDALASCDETGTASCACTRSAISERHRAAFPSHGSPGD